MNKDVIAESNAEKRNPGLEMYRIICMLFIVLHHFAVHGLDSSDGFGSGINKYIADILSFGGKIGVNGFVLISGYFMARSKYTVKKFLRLWGQVWFYSVTALGIFFLISGGGSIGGTGNILKALLPVLFSQYWFVTSFVVLMILSPFLNYVVQNIKEKQYRSLLLVLFILCSFVPTFIGSELSTSLTWFMFLYFIAAYKRLYNENYKDDKAIRHGALAVLGIIALWSSSVLINLAGVYSGREGILLYSRHFMSMESVIVLAVSYELFMAFLCRKRFYSNTINIIASGAFGVYLIHNNSYLRIILWRNIVRYADRDNPVYLVLYSLLCVILIYVICTLIDLARQYTVEKLWVKFTDRYGERGWSKIKAIFHKIYDFFMSKYGRFIKAEK